MGQRIDPNKRFERERMRAKQDERARLQQEQEALNRKFQSQGLAASGAAIKSLTKSEARSQEAVARRLEDIAGRQQLQQGR